MKRTTKLVITTEKLMLFVTGKMSFSEMIDYDNDIQNIELEPAETYYLLPEDIREAVKFFIEEKKPCEYVTSWFNDLIWSVGELTHVPMMLGEKDTAIEELYYDVTDYPFFENREELARYVFGRLAEIDDYCWALYDRADEYCQSELRDILFVLDNFKENSGKPHADWVLSERQKQDCIFAFDSKDTLESLPEEDKKAYKKILLELVDKENPEAVKALGFACYGEGNPLFDCDWEKSKNCFLKLMEVGNDYDKAQAANSLGYIYYYGRCNAGEPQYEEAYKYFSYAAFHGFYEATYKVGDMLRDGKGIFKNEDAAFRLYDQVYKENYPIFMVSDDTVFCDAALRMAQCYKDGISVEKDLMLSYYYYLAARLAIESKLEVNDFFGLKTVYENILTGLEEVKRELGEECERKSIKVNAYSFIKDVLFGEDVNELYVGIEKAKKGTNLAFVRLENYDFSPEPCFLMDVPEMSYCELTTSVKFFVPKKYKVKTGKKKEDFLIDDVKYSNGKIKMYYKGKNVITVETDEWQFRG